MEDSLPDPDALPPMPPALETDPAERLRKFALAMGIHYSRTVVALRAVDGQDVVRGSGSALVVVDPEAADEIRLLTARHNVADARANGCTLYVEVPRPGTGDRLFVDLCSLEDAAWTLSADDDLAVAPLPVGRLPRDHLVGGVHIDRVGYMRLDPTPEVTCVGRWGELQSDNFVIARRGLLATMERPEVDVYLGGDVQRTRRPMYIVDATITRGMSGGAVFTPSGMFTPSPSGPPFVLGIISGHLPLPEPLGRFKTLPESARNIAQAIWDELGPLNAGLVYVVPFDRARAFLDRGPRKNKQT